MQRVMAFDSQQARVTSSSAAEELSGSLRFQDVDNKLMHLVLENDKQTVEDGRLVSAAINQGMSGFTPDLVFEKLVKEYSMTQHLYGEKLIRLLSGYDPRYLKKNLSIPEFQRELKKGLNERFERLRHQEYLTREGSLTEKARELAALVLYLDELEQLVSKGVFGTKPNKRRSVYGDKDIIRDYKKGDRYRNIAIRQSVKIAIRRLHRSVDQKDLRVFENQNKGTIEVIYAIDASGSMRGRKIEMAKRAGIALAYTAMDQQDRVGLLVFGSDVREAIRPTKDFTHLLKRITLIKAAQETNITVTIRKAVELFPADQITKHLLLLTDCLPTAGKEPEKETLEAVSYAQSLGITISLVGISLDKKGKHLAEQIVELGNGRLYIAQNIRDLDLIILRDYYSIS